MIVTHNSQKESDRGSLLQKRSVIIAFLICFISWIYLFFLTKMEINFDAIGYEDIGLTIYKSGWIEYFRGGPRREPLYPFLISLSMYAAEIFKVPYAIPQKIIQILAVFLTQILTLVILKKLKVKNSLQLFAILYLGFSPAIMNSAFSLFSEIATYPLVLAIILAAHRLWISIRIKGYKQSLLGGVTLALFFLAATFTKGVFQGVLYFFLIPFIFLGLHSLLTHQKKICIASVFNLLLIMIIFQSCFISFKLMNKKYNGLFEFTDRYGLAIYGNAAKRAKEMNLRVFMAYLASVPGDGFCRRFFSVEECKYYSWESADKLWGYELPKLLAGVPSEKQNEKAISLAKDKIAKNPLQHFVLSMIEGMKIFFWESTQLGNVTYPNWLRTCYDFPVFKNGLRLIISLLTIYSFLFLLYYLFQNKTKLFQPPSANEPDCQLCFFIVLMVSSFTALYAFLHILTRFALPLAPLFIICIAFCLNNQHFFCERFRNHSILLKADIVKRTHLG